MLEAGYEGTIFFTNPSYEDAFLGISSDDRAIYDYEKMIESLVNHEDMTEDEAREFIDYNATFYIEGGPHEDQCLRIRTKWYSLVYRHLLKNI